MVLVFGSINIDLVTRVERFPGPGETVSGISFAIYPGGKGANQALASAHAGAPTWLVGAVGRDAFAATPAAGALTGAVVVLIDYVSTTGATLDACAGVLKRAGIAEVRALTAARVVGRLTADD